MPLYRIDLSRLVSNYIGETEKNLRRVFDAAEDAGAVLFFDEADALFGKRSEVKDSHDRYANLEMAHLWERVERFNGAVIVSFNRPAKIDETIRRRFRCIMPTRAQKPPGDRDLRRSAIPQHRTIP